MEQDLPRLFICVFFSFVGLLTWEPYGWAWGQSVLRAVGPLEHFIRKHSLQHVGTVCVAVPF